MATALITGASSGLGEEFARQLARERYDLVLAARREDRLQSVAGEARSLGAANVLVVATDLGKPGSAETLIRKIEADGIQLSYLVNNAGFGTRGKFEQLPLEREIEEIDLNVSSLVALTRLALPAMVARRQGTIINVASTAAFQPLPWMATYGATKSFVLSFSEALAYELKKSGVTVMALCPGPTHTGFQAVASTTEANFPAFSYMDAVTVVAQAIDAAKRGKAIHINGIMNQLMAQTTRFTPRALVTRISGRLIGNPAT